MKKYIITLGLITLATTHMYGSEQPTLDKKAQKEFRQALAGYRGMFVHLKVLEATGGEEVKAETRLRLKLENKIQQYAIKNNDNTYVEKKIERLEKFKTEEVPQRLQQMSQPKIEFKEKIRKQSTNIKAETL